MARTRFFRSHLYGSTALGSLILSGCLLFPAHAQEVIGGSDTVVVDGRGDGTTGTQNSPWDIGDELSIGAASGDDSKLVIQNGGSVSNTFGYIGFAPGATGAATVTGTGSTWENSVTLNVGEQGDGTLTVSNGATVSSAGSVIGSQPDGIGTVTVTGADSVWTAGSTLTVGYLGDATLTIANGGVVSNTHGIVGLFGGSTGTVTVSGAGSTWTNSSGLMVGRIGTGTLTIAEGGVVSAASVTVANNSVSTGTLNIGAAAGDAAVGAGTLNAATLAFGDGDGTLVFNHTDTDYVFDTAISGPGNISHLAGTTIFTADSSGFTGDTNVNGGMLTIRGQLGGDFAAIGRTPGASGLVNVTGAGASWTISTGLYVGEQADGTLTISDGGSVSTGAVQIGLIPGSTGAVTVTGAGSTWTNSADLFVGFFGDGTLSISDGGSVSNTIGTIGFGSGFGVGVSTVTVAGAGSIWANSSALFVGYGGNGALTISDDGMVDVDGTMTIARNTGSTGTLNIGAASGSAAVAAGTLSAATVRFGDGTGTINFNHTETDYDFAAVIAGAGTINQIAGVTKLTADSSGFAGTTNVAGGTLSVNNALGGAINMNGGRLGGSGTLGDVTIASGGTLAPGNSIGTLNVASATFNAGSVYEVEVNSAGQSDLIDSTGTATLNGGIVRVVPFPDFALDTQYTILTAAGGIVGGGTFDNVELNSLFLTPTLAYGANDVFLTIAQTANFADVALTPNQIAAAGGAQSLGGDALFSAIALLGDANETRAALDAISGEVHASAKTALIEDSRFVREAAVSRTRAMFDAVASDRSAAERKVSDRFALWGQGFGAWGDWDGDTNAASLDRSIGGLFLGGDARVADNVRVGALAGYSHSNLNVAARASSAAVESGYAALYGGGQWGALGLRVGGAYGWHGIETARSVVFTGFSDYLAASYDAGTAQAFGEAAWRIDAGGATRLEPFANLAYVNLDADAFTESGGAAALSGNSDQTDAPFLTLGLRADTAFLLGEARARVTGSLGWQHVFGDDVPVSLMTFVAGGGPFAIAGVPLAEDVLVVDAGLGVMLAPDATLGLTYGGQFGAEMIDQSVKGGVNVKF